MLEDYPPLISVARDYFANDFPQHPQDACPDAGTLDGVIKSRKLPDDNLRAHLLGCSECFKYFHARLSARPLYDEPATAWERFGIALASVRRPLGFAALIGAACLTVWSIWHYLNPLRPRNAPAPPPSSAELAHEIKVDSPTPAATPTPQNPRAVETPAPKRPAVKNSPPGVGRSATLAAHLVRIDLSGRQLLRGEGDLAGAQPIRVAPVRNNMAVRLPEGSRRGSYTVSLVDAFGNMVVTGRTKSADGKTLAVILDMRAVPAKSYRLCLSRADSVPSCYPLVVNGER